MISPFQFKAFKIDNFSFKSKPQVNLLARQDAFKPEDWEIKFRFRVPIYLSKSQTYIGGLDMLVTIPDKEVTPSDDKSMNEGYLLQLEAGIAGFFAVEGPLEKTDEEALVKIQIPALLLPYLRGTITTFVANSGFGSVILPLINIRALATESLASTEIQVIEE